MRIRQLLSEVKAPLRRALELVSPHFAEIRAEWQNKLAILGLKEDSWKVLFPLTLEARYQNLLIPHLDAYRQELETHGKILERSGISEASTSASFTFYLECCLPYLCNVKQKGKDYAVALTRLTTTSQFLTLSSYAAEWGANWRKLQERERLSISRDLHDDIGHNLLVLKLYLELMAGDLKRGDIAPLQGKLEEALALVSNAVDSVRRLMLDMGPAMLAQFSFVPALKIYARQFTLRTGIQVQLSEVAMPGTLPSSYETALYRVLQGALSNIVQHSNAKHVKVTLGSMKKSVLVMSIEDDGTGFDADRQISQQAFGLTAMRERIEVLGGRFHIESTIARHGSKKHGSRIEVDLPLNGVV